MRSAVVLSCLFSAAALLCVVAAQPAVRPSLPQLAFIEIGTFDCSSADGGYCAGGDANGLIRAYMSFDTVSNELTNYREEAILNNSFIYYNREYATANTTHEYMLANGQQQLMCFDMKKGGVINRHFLLNATFAGNETIRDIPVWSYTGEWYARGNLSSYRAWVRMDDPTKLLGWTSGGARYLYLSYHALTSIPAGTFTPPAGDDQCGIPPVPPPPPPGPEPKEEGVKGLRTAGAVFAVIVALEHVYFLVLEMILWRGRARKIFGTTEDFANASAGLAANQGLYNGFLSAGIIYGLATTDVVLLTFSLSCVIVAGVFGALTVGIKIFFIQAVPAILATIFVQFGHKPADDWNRHNPLYTLIYVLIGVLVGGIALGWFVCRRETALGSYDKKKKPMSEQEHANP